MSHSAVIAFMDSVIVEYSCMNNCVKNTKQTIRLCETQNIFILDISTSYLYCPCSRSEYNKKTSIQTELHVYKYIVLYLFFYLVFSASKSTQILSHV